MPFIPFHPAPGIGEMMPGAWYVPNNPIEEGAVKVAVRTPHLGEMMPAFFSLPQNPVFRGMSGCLPGLSGEACGCGSSSGSGMSGCGCGGGCQVGFLKGTAWGNGGAYTGMGDLNSMLAGLTSGGWQTWAAVGGGILLLMMLMPGGARYQEKKRKLREEYKGKLRSLRSRERGYRRVGRRSLRAAQELVG